MRSGSFHRLYFSQSSSDTATSTIIESDPQANASNNLENLLNLDNSSNFDRKSLKIEDDSKKLKKVESFRDLSLVTDFVIESSTPDISTKLEQHSYRSKKHRKTIPRHHRGSSVERVNAVGFF